MNNKIIDNDIKGKQNQQFDILTVRNNIPYVISNEELQPIDPLKKEEVISMAQDFKRNNLVKVRRRGM